MQFVYRVGIAFGKGTTTTCFHCCGTDPDDNEELKISQAGMPISKAKSFTILLGMLSGPGAVCIFIRVSSFHICDLATVGGGQVAGR